jgi:hypothetical protein
MMPRFNAMTRGEVRDHTREIVRRHEDRAATLRESFEEIHQLLLRRWIDTGRGLIEQEELGFRCEGAGEEDALLLATGQGTDRPAREVGGVDVGQRVARHGALRGARPSTARLSRDPAHQDHVLDEEWIVPAQLLRLREVRDAPRRPCWLAEDHGRSGHRGQDSDNDLEQCRLPRAVRADERDQLTGLHREVDAGDDGPTRVVSRGNTAQLDHVGHPQHDMREISEALRRSSA